MLPDICPLLFFQMSSYSLSDSGKFGHLLPTLVPLSFQLPTAPELRHFWCPYKKSHRLAMSQASTVTGVMNILDSEDDAPKKTVRPKESYAPSSSSRRSQGGGEDRFMVKGEGLGCDFL